MAYLLAVVLVAFCVVWHCTNAEDVPADDSKVQEIALKSCYTLYDGGNTCIVRTARREPVPSGWKYFISMDVYKYGESKPVICHVVGIYNPTTDVTWLPYVGREKCEE